MCLLVLVAALVAPLHSLYTIPSARSSMCARRSLAGNAQHGDGPLSHRRRPCAWLRLVPIMVTPSVPFTSLEALLRPGPFLEGVILRNFPCCCRYRCALCISTVCYSLFARRLLLIITGTAGLVWSFGGGEVSCGGIYPSGFEFPTRYRCSHSPEFFPGFNRRYSFIQW